MTPLIHLSQDTWIRCPVDEVAALLAEEPRWSRWWPGLDVQVSRDRALKGLQWRVGPSAARYVGSAEVWLEPFAEGVVWHQFLRLDLRAGTRTSRWSTARGRRRWARHCRITAWQVKDELEGRRPPAVQSGRMGGE